MENPIFLIQNKHKSHFKTTNIYNYSLIARVKTSQATYELLGICSLKTRLETDFKQAQVELELIIKLVY